MNPTITKFGYPQTLIAEYRHWVVLLRPAQVTVGSLVLAHKPGAAALGAVSADAFAELATVTADIERALGAALSYERLNYLCLMMTDREVHFHVLPRYSSVRTVAGISHADRYWPKAPDVTQPPLPIEGAALAALLDLVKTHWPKR